ncbi:1-acyl-sn-glycerol-3-phosphate acyltransferase [Candidatus Woesearchaeota archaeon]|nr:1-acyl-sn-glycerol-3-phosphate acyltransferase [Candidatus Woesearchaeota archaeon]MBW3016046.1 1-acyl-sn-glycerol-3-phosphate acyltransferase [Candidatus Woesearchaeota archaeon]
MERINWLYRAGEIFVNFYFKARYQLSLKGTIPKGPCVLLPKHQQMLDIPLEGHIIYRQTRQPATYVMRGFPFPFNKLFEALGGIQIARPKDIKKGKITREKARRINQAAEQKLINRLKQGDPVIIHPEGTRKYQSMNPININPKSMLSKIVEAQSYLGKIPFVPVGIEYDNQRIRVISANPFYTDNTKTLEEHLRKEIPKLSNIIHNTEQSPENKHPNQPECP